MTTNPEHMTGTLRELAEGEPVPPAPVERLLSRGRRAKRTRALGVSTAALGLIGVVTIGAVGLNGMTGTSPDAGRQPAVAAEAAAFQLTSAAEATAQTTFRLVVTQRSEVRTWRTEGAYDPVAKRGYLRWTDEFGNVSEQRVVDGEVYVITTIDGKPNQARKLTGGTGFSFGTLTGDQGATLSVDPADLLKTLKSLGTVKDLGGGRYSFTHDADGPGGPVSGTVEVASGKVSKVSYELSRGRSLVLEFSDYGTPVTVERP